MESAPTAVIIDAFEINLLGQSWGTTKGLQGRRPVRGTVRVRVCGRASYESVPLIGAWRLYFYSEILRSPEPEIG